VSDRKLNYRELQVVKKKLNKEYFPPKKYEKRKKLGETPDVLLYFSTFN